MDITEVLSLAILLLVSILSTFVIPVLKQKLGQEKLNKILVYVEIAVTAAEQMFDVEQGAEKKAYVLEYLQSELSNHNLTVDTETLENLIEAQVLLLHRELNRN